MPAKKDKTTNEKISAEKEANLEAREKAKKIREKELPLKKEISSMDITLPLIKDLKHDVTRIVTQVRDKAREKGKLDNHINLKLEVIRGVNYQMGQVELIKQLECTFKNGVTIITEVK